MTKKRRSQGTIRTADVIALLGDKLVLIERLRPPFGLALPGGHVDPGETPRQAAIREFTEETGLTLRGTKFFTERKGRRRDPRYRMSKTRAYAGNASGKPRNEKGFTKVVLFSLDKVRALPRDRFAFDHASIIEQYFGLKKKR